MSEAFKRDQRTLRIFKKHYLPGYTGHVPTKFELFGMTTGEINK
jgi:hypothetical protein